MRRAIDLTTSWEDFSRGARIPILEDVVGEDVAEELAAAGGHSSDEEQAVQH